MSDSYATYDVAQPDIDYYEKGPKGGREPLSFDEYQRRTQDTAIYPGQGTVDGLVYATLGLVGEAAEVANKVKKILRDNGGVLTPEIAMAIGDELGDVQWYLAQAAKELTFSLEEIAATNLAKLDARKRSGTLQGSGDRR